MDELEDKDLDFEHKFKKWLKSSKGKHEIYVPSFPNLRELMKDHQFNRYQTYNIRNDYPFDGYWSCIVEEDGKEIAEEEDWDYDVILKAAKEAMDNNLKSFKYDW